MLTNLVFQAYAQLYHMISQQEMHLLAKRCIFGIPHYPQHYYYKLLKYYKYIIILMMVRISEVIAKKSTTTKPIWLMRQAGRYLPEYLEIRGNYSDFLKMCLDTESVVNITLQPLKRFNLDAGIIFSDILLILHLTGVEVLFNNGISVEDIEIESFLKKTSPTKKNYLPMLQAISEVRKRIDTDKDLIGFAGSPWTVATYLLEKKDRKSFVNIRSIAYKQRDLFKKLIDRLIDVTSQYLIYQIEAGADLVKLFDSWSGVLPEEEFEEWVIKPTARIVEIVKQKYPNVSIIGFAKNSGLNLKKYINQTGISAVALDYTVPIKWAAENIDIALQGNLDPVLLANDIDLSIKHTKNILDLMRNKVFIFSLGHGVLPNTPVDNVKKLVDFVNNYRYQ